MRRFLLATLLLAVSSANGQDAPAPGPGVTRSALFVFAAGDRIEDAGVLEVTGGRFNRREDFEVVRKADGSRVLSSVTVAAGGQYRVEGRWHYDERDAALRADGLGHYAGQPAAISIRRDGELAEIDVDGAVSARHRAWCADDCLIDMSPSALPMFTMTRRYDQSRGGPQVFRWVARSLIFDQVLLDGSAEIIRLGEYTFDAAGGAVEVRQYRFVETLKDEASGDFAEVAFNLYTDAGHRPLAFATAGTTVGVREGYEGITRALPPQFD